MKHCRTAMAPRLLATCSACHEKRLVPHSCGHRNCPHCQHHESQQWVERQVRRHVPGNHFLLTFTLPVQLRDLAWHNQRTLYAVLFECAWATVSRFSRNDRHLQGHPGAVAVLHTHSRRDSKTGKHAVRTVSGAYFLYLILQHVLPKGFRRARNFGFLHPNSKRLLALLQVVLRVIPTADLSWTKPRPPFLCSCCGAPMRIVRRRLPPPRPCRSPSAHPSGGPAV